jgi:hypothetical protein
MAEFLCRGYKCACGQVVQIAQLDKAKPLPKEAPRQQYVGGWVGCPRCGKDTFVKPNDWIEWTKEEAVH